MNALRSPTVCFPLHRVTGSETNGSGLRRRVLVNREGGFMTGSKSQSLCKELMNHTYVLALFWCRIDPPYKGETE